MPIQPFDTRQFVRDILGLGWRWGGVDNQLLMHPTNHDFYLRYDQSAERLTLSPELDAHLELVIPTPAGKSKTFR